jgi:DNA-binding NarL/FixJ family response regulator
MSIRLLVVDDHPIIREGLQRLFAGTEIVIALEAASPHEALKSLRAGMVDVALIDVRFPNGDGLELLAHLKARFPKLPVLMFSAYANPKFIARANSLEAAGYILKGDSQARIISLIRQAAQGERCWDREELRRASVALTAPRVEQDVVAPLTQRESEVLRQMALGRTNKQIAQDLKISYETVKEHVQHVLEKIGVSDRTQAAVWAVREGVV